MKRYVNSIDFFKNNLMPKKDLPLSWNTFNTKNQSKLIAAVNSLSGVGQEGEISETEIEVLDNIRAEISVLRNQYSSVSPDRLDIDLAIIGYSAP